MLILVSGGSASGKSAFAEGLITASGIERRVYLATMEAYGEEGERRVRRHLELRRGKGFSTLELPRGLDDAKLPEGSAVLIEDVGNLVANECFTTEAGFDGAASRAVRGVLRLAEQNALTVAVTNELGADGVFGMGYSEDTVRYIRLMAEVNAALASAAGEVYEVVSGVPMRLKGDVE